MIFWKKFFHQRRLKKLARQLRKPEGSSGTKTGVLMNRSNAFMYGFTLQQLQLQQNEKVLEIGFGNGHFFSEIYKQAPGLSLFGIDYSAQMVKEASAANEEMISGQHLLLITGNSDALPWPDNFFDKIFCINVIYFWNQPSAHLQEIKRVLKPGGRFCATCRTKDNMSQLPFTAFNFTTYNPEEWEVLLKNAGFSIIKSVTADEPGIQQQGVHFAARQWCVTAEK